MKARAKELGIADIRVNNAGCLERCELGPAMVVYPEGVWYQYHCKQDVDEILESHILNDQPVIRLMLRDGQKYPDDRPVEYLNLIVTDIRSICDEILRVEFGPHGANSLPAFSAGAHLTLLIDDDRLRRCYSIVNDPVDRQHYVIYVARKEHGRGGSDWIRTQLKLGDVIQARRPENSIALDESATQHVLIGEGIGIAPFIAMSRRLRDVEADFQLHYFVGSLESDAILSQLQTICKERLILHQQWTELAEQKHALANALRSNSQGQHVYICGSRRWAGEIMQVVSSWPSESVHAQYFEPAVDESLVSHHFNVTLARRQKTLRVNADQSVLEVLRKSNYPVDYGCEEGLCGACRATVLSGEVDHRDSVLTRTERLRGDTMLTCVSRARDSGSRLLLDI